MSSARLQIHCVNGNGKGKVIHSNDTRRMFREVQAQAQKTDICFCWNKKANDFGLHNKEEMGEQMKWWRKQAKEGILAMITQNNQEIVFNGRTYWTLCVQSYKNGALDTDNGFNSIDIGGSVFGGDDNFRMVSGAIYAFTSKVNRDLAFNYTMKGIKTEYGIQVA